MKKKINVILVCCLFLVGCGGGDSANDPTVSWSGEVTLNGKSLPEDLTQAVIQVCAKEQGNNVAAPTQGTIVQGKFTLKQVPRGVVIVRVILEQKTGKTIHETSGETFEEIVNLVPQAKRAGFEMTADKNDMGVKIAL